MMNPRVCWIANVRTIWTQLVLKHNSFEKADNELGLYRESDPDSEMDYKTWAVLHADLAPCMADIAEESQRLARGAGVSAGSLTYIWADCVANALYEGN